MRYLTRDWYLKCQTYPRTQALDKELKEIEGAYRVAQDREQLPTSLRKGFVFHDGVISKIVVGKDCTIEISSPYSPYHKVIFRDALIKQELPPVGATWLYEELYNHKSGTGYEAHILSFRMMGPSHKGILESDLFETKIICSDIEFEYSEM